MSNYDDNGEKANGMPEVEPQMPKVPDIAKKAGKKIGNKAKKQVAKMALKMLKAISKALIKLLMIVIKILIALLPYILIFLCFTLLVYFAWSIIFNTRGVTQNKQTEDTMEYNSLVKDEKSGDYIPADLSSGNKVVNAFYTYFSEKSIWCTITDEYGVVTQKTPMQYNSTEFQKEHGEASTTPVKDKYNRESKFYLNPEALWTLDEFLNKSMFRFPEQFIKPVYHDETTYDLKEIEDSTTGELIPDSTSYKHNDEGKLVKDGDKKEKGVWDYGFGSIINYKKYIEEHKAMGNYVRTEVWNKEEQSIEQKTIAELNDKGTSGYQGIKGDELTGIKYKEGFKNTESYMIDRVTCPAGFVYNKIKFEWEDSGKPYVKAVKHTTSVDVRHEREVTDYDDEGHESGSHTEIYYVSEPKEFTTIVEGTYLDKVPKYVGDPDLSKITGNKYYKDYITHYKSYVPEDVMGNLGIADLKNRTGKDQEQLLKLLERQTFATSSNKKSTSDFSSGQGATADAVSKLAQYEVQIQEYSSKMGVDPDFVKALIIQESSGDINADNNGYGFGLMQLEMTQYGGKPMTITYLDGSTETVTPTSDNMKDNVDLQLKCGIQELRNSSKLFNYNLYAGMCGYNFGQGGEQYILKTYISRRDGISLTEAGALIPELLKSGDTGWMDLRKWYSDGGYKEISADGGGDAEYIEHIMQYYPQGQIPYIVDDSGTKISMDGTTESGFANVNTSKGGLTGVNNWLKSYWKKLKNEWSKLFPNMPGELSPNKMYYEHQADEKETDTIIKMMTAMAQHKKLEELKDMTVEDWKHLFYLWFSNPLSDPWDEPSTINVTKYFPKGWEKPLDFSPLSIQKKYDPENFHLGIDITAPTGTPVYAMDDGIVDEVCDDYNLFTLRIGKFVRITNSSGTTITYGSLDTIDVKKGDKITKKQKIATTGNSEDITKKAHLHLEIKKGTETIDPSWVATGGGVTLDGYNLSDDDKQIIGNVLDYAQQAIGKPYPSGDGDQREGPDKFDCSGLVWWAYWKGTGGAGDSESEGGGISIGHVTTGLASTLQEYKIKADGDLQPGDIIGWNMQNSGSGAHVCIIKSVDGDNVTVINAGGGACAEKIYPRSLIGPDKKYNEAYRPIAYIRDKINGKV